MACTADLADESPVGALLPSAEAALGPIGCLVNNAAVFVDDTIETATRESWDLHLAVNLRAPFVLIQEMAAWLLDTGAWMHGLWEDPGYGVADPDDSPARRIAVPNARAAFLQAFGYQPAG